MHALSLELEPSAVGPQAKGAVLKAVALDSTLAEAQAVLAFNIHWFEWAWDTAEAHFAQALEFDPDSVDTLWMYAHLPSNTGRHTQALAAIGRARTLDPLSGLITAMEGQMLLHAGRTDDAIDRLREAIEIEPRSRVAHLFAARAYIEKGLFDAAAGEGEAARARLVQLSRERYVSPTTLRSPATA
jgi:tetratricopeptide (TPR) repeat protein